MSDKQIVDLQLRLENSDYEKDQFMVKTSMSVDKLIEECERVMREVEEEALENNEFVTFGDHIAVIEDRLDVEVVKPEKTEAICPVVDEVAE